MVRQQRTRFAATVTADRLNLELGNVGLAVANPLRGQPLAVPRDVRLGDTPEGAPAVLWAVPPGLDKHGVHRDWSAGGPAEQAFWAFADLADEQRPERFVAFARRFGPLGLWPYVTPDGHKIAGLDYWVPSVPDGIWTPHRYTTADGGEYRAYEEAGLFGLLYEPIAEWRRWAGWLRAVLEIAYALRSGGFGSRQQWTALGLGFWFDPERWAEPAPRVGTDASLQRRMLADVVQRRFLRWSGLVPVFQWEVAQPRLALALGGKEAILMPRTSMQHDWPENSLFPALVAQLVAVITASQPVAACSRCGRIHPRARRPRVDRPAYCTTCQPEAVRANKRTSAAKTRARNRLEP